MDCKVFKMKTVPILKILSILTAVGLTVKVLVQEIITTIPILYRCKEKALETTGTSDLSTSCLMGLVAIPSYLYASSKC